MKVSKSKDKKSEHPDPSEPKFKVASSTKPSWAHLFKCKFILAENKLLLMRYKINLVQSQKTNYISLPADSPLRHCLKQGHAQLCTAIKL